MIDTIKNIGTNSAIVSLPFIHPCLQETIPHLRVLSPGNKHPWPCSQCNWILYRAITESCTSVMFFFLFSPRNFWHLLTLCVTYCWLLNSVLLTTNLWTLCYLLMAHELCITYYWPLHFASHTTDLWTLHNIPLTPDLWLTYYLTSELCITYYWSLNSSLLTSDPEICITYYWPVNSALLILDPYTVPDRLLTSKHYIAEVIKSHSLSHPDVLENQEKKVYASLYWHDRVHMLYKNLFLMQHF